MKEILEVITDGDGDRLTVESDGPLLYLDTSEGASAVAFTRFHAKKLRVLLDRFIGEAPDLGLSRKDALHLRRLFWLGHGCTGLYGDDGEMQCGDCGIDFRRMRVAEIEAFLRKRGEKQLEDAKPQQYRLTVPSAGTRTLDQLSDAELKVALDAVGAEALRRDTSKPTRAEG